MALLELAKVIFKAPHFEADLSVSTRNRSIYNDAYSVAAVAPRWPPVFGASTP
jgi:hypothetical protein